MKKLIFASLQVRDLEVSKAFYLNKLGFQLEMENPEACIFKYNQGEASFAIRKPVVNLDGKELGVGTSLWFAIDEKIEEFQKQLTDNGVLLLGEINSTPFGRTIMAKDPDGYIITFLEETIKNQK